VSAAVVRRADLVIAFQGATMREYHPRSHL
jgi:hypothetical protein